MAEGGKPKVNQGTNGKRKFNKQGKGKGKGAQKRGKGGKEDLDFLYEEDDGGHFGLLKHSIPSDLTRRNWVSVDLGDVIPEGFDVSQFVCAALLHPILKHINIVLRGALWGFSNWIQTTILTRLPASVKV
jgi:hypothetical protein